MENTLKEIANASASVVEAPTSSLDFSWKNARILVVDDDASLRILARLTLEQVGFQVIEASGGYAALRLVNEQPVDCVLLDWRMPGMSGRETCQQLRRQCNQNMLPIVIITGERDNAAVQDAFAAGASDYVKKPVDWEVVRERIKFAVHAKRVADQFAASQKVQDSLYAAMPDAILHLDFDGTIVGYKPPVDGRMSIKWDCYMGQRLQAMVEPADRNRVDQFLQHLREGSIYAMNLDIPLNQEVASVELCSFKAVSALKMSHCFDLPGAHFIVVRDFTEHHQAQARIHQLEFFDERTGLPNHKMMAIALDEEINVAYTLGQSVHVLKITLGQFDNIAFTLGKEHGDCLMRTIGDRLHEICEWHFANGESTDCRVIIGKTGESEFTLVYRGPASENTFKSSADELGKRLSGPFPIDGYEVTIFPHLGVASYPKHASQSSLLLERSAAAAKHAMQEHQVGCLVYSSQSHKRMIRRIDIESRIRKGLEKGHFDLVYQPKVESTSRTMVGVEALLRWNDPELGSISPGEFIPIAEQSALIIPIGEFVLRAACSQARFWQQQGLSALPIAINFSTHQFSQQGIIELIDRELNINSLNGAALEIELTETAAMNNEDNVIRILNHMKNIGIKSAIDDFGTGYSSMKYLRILPVDTVKIDRSFIQALATEESAQAIIVAIIQMAHTLGKRVVAEGVEDQAQMDFLTEHGCDFIQGFLTGRPESAEQISRRWMSRDFSCPHQNTNWVRLF